MRVTVDEEELLSLGEALWLPRIIEEKMLLLLRQGRLSKWFSGIGQEAVSVGVVHALRPDDWILPMHRNLGVFTARGVDLDRLLRQLLGKADGYTKGRDRSFHFGDLGHHIVGMISHLGATVPVAAGLALAARLRGEDRVAVTFTGDGGTSEGDVHEAMNLAAVWKLPVIFLIENNGFGLSTPTEEQYACADLADRAVGYGMPGTVVDGNDVLAVVDAVREAAARARSGAGPTLLECKTFRMRGHEETSGTDYVPAELLAEWAGRDPIARLDERLPPGRREARWAVIKADVDRRVAAALEVDDPDSTEDAERAEVFAPPPARTRPRPVSREPRDMRYLDAVTEGLREALAADERVVLMGQDIADYGGAFKATDGLCAEFGRERVRNTPIIESGAIGAALGLALDGFHPMVEMQFADFVTCGFNQVVNHLAKTHYRWGAPVPVVVRCPVGGGTGAGPFHSQNIEAWFTHVAGLKVVAPSTPADAKGLLLAAFDDANPVLFLEHKLLYRSATGPVPAGWHTVPIGEAAVVRPGRDATIVTYGAGVAHAIGAAEAVAADGHQVEVIDLRSLQPWDRGRVVSSVQSTGRALVLHEAPLTGGFGAEVAATIAEEAFSELDAPVMRVAGLDTPVPFAKALEELVAPWRRLLPRLRELLAY
ncbi:MAG TPA: dehydrogenase E1 component subunit alpha/beta [Acidimicrobiales bacterium]|nr:dehydrogenase E1 component subunit alpha/beta [Acidimicrobiales bacterium]